MLQYVCTVHWEVLNYQAVSKAWKELADSSEVNFSYLISGTACIALAHNTLEIEYSGLLYHQNHQDGNGCNWLNGHIAKQWTKLDSLSNATMAHLRCDVVVSKLSELLLCVQVRQAAFLNTWGLTSLNEEPQQMSFYLVSLKPCYHPLFFHPVN